MAIPLLSLINLGRPAMLLFALAALAPILIHWLSRRHQEEVSWAAMRFLLAAMQRSSRRLRLEQYLLLALRVGILLLLAVAVADPYWGKDLPESPEKKRGPRHVVIVVDGSYSMHAEHQGESCLDHARSMAADLVQASQIGDRFSLLLLADPPQVVIANPTAAKEPLLLEIDRLRPPFSGGDLQATLLAAQSLIKKGRHDFPELESAQLFFITDLGDSTWQPLVEGDLNRPLHKLAQLADLQILLAGEASAPMNHNVAIASLRANSQLLSLKRATTFTASLHNYGDADLQQQRAELLVDGEPVEEKLFDIPPQGDASLSFSYQFNKPGLHAITCRLEADRLPIDNEAYLVVDVQETIQAACMGNASQDIHFLKYALEPADGARRNIEVITWGQHQVADNLDENIACLIISNVSTLSVENAAAIQAYVEKGGGLILFLGDRFEKENLRNTWMHQIGLDKAERIRVVDTIASSQPCRFDPLHYAHPLLHPFRGNEKAGLLSAPTWKYFRIEPGKENQVALAFENGDPAIVEASLGEGRILVVATAASDASFLQAGEAMTPWTMLPLSPSFPPLLHNMVEHASQGRRAAWQSVVGEPLHGRLKKGSHEPAIDLFLERSSDESLIGNKQTLHPEWDDSGQYWMQPESSYSGIYGAHSQLNQELLQMHAVNLDLGLNESDLKTFEIADLPSALQGAGARSPFSHAGSAQTEPHLFVYVLFGVIALVISETVLAWWMERQAKH